jgi:hypothetical protein
MIKQPGDIIASANANTAGRVPAKNGLNCDPGK